MGLDGDNRGVGGTMIYCVVPRDLAGSLQDPLRRHFADDPRVEVVVEQRADERRARQERRDVASPAEDPDRRRIHARDGRRMGVRRAPGVPSADRIEDVEVGRLVSRIQAGEADLFGELYLRCFDQVYAYLRVAFRDQHEAEDAAQAVFVKVHQALARYDRNRGPFRGWLFAIVRNHAIDELRRLQRVRATAAGDIERHQDGVTEPDAQPADLGALGWISDREILMLVERLPLVQRQVVVLRFMFGFGTTEIGQLLELTPAHVRKLQSRALEFLRLRLTALGRPSRGKPSRMLRARKMAPVLRVRRFALIDRT
jgi:RNA polymerase sigma-70 factor (ECF subfamily)